MSELYEILAIKYAHDLTRKHGQCFISSTDMERPNPLDYFVWLIRNENRSILVDTGFNATEAKKRSRTLLREPVAALVELGVDAATLKDVVITHLHYDHAGTLDAFPSATFHIQEAEAAYATGPCMCEAHLREPFTADHICSYVQKLYSGRVRFANRRDAPGSAGGTEIAPGVTLHHIGGHSRGLQAVRVATARGPVVLASDASHFYENFEKRSPFVIVVDMEDMLRGYTTLYELADGDGTRIIPGHDPRVMERYPAYSAAASGLVCRLDLPPLT